LIKLFLRIILSGFVLFSVVAEISYAQDTLLIKKHLSYLGSDLFGGRGSGTIGGELSAKYIALYLNKYELKPMGYENTFYQYLPMHGSQAKESSKIILMNDSSDTLTINNDFEFFHTSGRIFTPNLISLAFVGYGIIASEFDYDDYKDVDVEGKIAVYFGGEPYSDDPDYFNGQYSSKYSFADTKQKIALSKGAVGTIQIPNYRGTAKDLWEKLIHEFYFEDITLAYLPTPMLSLLISPKSAKKLFDGSQYSFEQVSAQRFSGELKSFYLKSKLLLQLDFNRRDFISPNVVGYLKGNDEKFNDEYVVISAHYDHLGIGLPVKGDSIYNGVLDNGIGVSVLLELASKLSENNYLLKRSIIFLFTTGEEKGLLGSKYFVDHTPVPVDKIVANINIDGFAVIDDFRSVVGVGAEFSSMNDILRETADEAKLKLEKIPAEFDSFESFLHSDQLSFANAGIPSILVSDGVDYVNVTKSEGIRKWKDYIHNKYHTPFDDLMQKINYEAVQRHFNFMYNFILNVANTKNEINWNNSSPYQSNNK